MGDKESKAENNINNEEIKDNENKMAKRPSGAKKAKPKLRKPRRRSR